nr:FAD-dependent oxidoreductase [Kineococcus indalonis]
MAQPRAAQGLRRRRRRRARPGHRALPGGGARHHGRRRAGEGLAGRREHGPQHHPIRSHYLWDASAATCEHSLELWEHLEEDLGYPVLGATHQPRAGIAKHDHVGWGFARRIDAAGVDVLQDCEVTGLTTDGDRVTGVRTTRGDIACGKVALAAAGGTSVLTDMLGIRVPIQSHPLQALVCELLEPVHPTIVMSNAVHVYVSQAHKGELVMGAGVEACNG